MEKTIRQALIDEINYPIQSGFVENKLIERGLDGDAIYSFEVFQSNEWKGALADCLCFLIQAVTISESDKHIGDLTDKDKERILNRASKLYEAIGEDPIIGQPTVYIGG